MRQALTEKIGVEEREVGWAIAPARVHETNEKNTSIYLFDTSSGGAGFVAQATAFLPELFRRARTKLDCPRDCDRACHACLLTYDTHAHSDQLDRIQGLAVLTDGFLRGFQVPDDLKIFGPDTAAEFEPLEIALRRELTKGDHVRLYLGGDPTDWELETWPLRRAIGRWAEDGTGVDLLLDHRCLEGLNPESRSRLAAWSDLQGVRVLRISASDLTTGGGQLLAEVGSAGAHVRFAVPQQATLAPGSEWGETGGVVQVLKYEGKGPLPTFRREGTSLSGADLRAAPAGTVAEVGINRELEVPIGEFGRRFWDLVLGSAPDLKARIEKGVHKVTYSDRYVRSPLTLRLLIESVRELSRRGANKQPELQILTTSASTTRNPHWVWDSWREYDDVPEIATRAVEKAGLMGRYAELDRSRVPHARELTIDFGDGDRAVVRLDHGFGFMGARERIPFAFHQNNHDQAEALLDMNLDLASRERALIYVARVQ